MLRTHSESLSLYACADEIQEAQTIRHNAQERLDVAYRAFVDFANGNPMRNANIDDDEAIATDDESESDDDDAEEGKNEVVVGHLEDFVGDEEDDENDESYHEN